MPSGVSQGAVACAGAAITASLNSTPVKSGTRVIHLSSIDDGRLLVRNLQDIVRRAQNRQRIAAGEDRRRAGGRPRLRCVARTARNIDLTGPSRSERLRYVRRFVGIVA